MKEIQGKYTSAKVFAKTLEENCIKQIEMLCNHPLFENKRIVFMPDIHVGVGTCIGTAAEIDSDHIIPWLLGNDIGCTISATKINGKTLKEFDKLDKVIKSLNVCKNKSYDTFKAYTNSICDYLGWNPNQYIKSVGSIGKGNHFISVEKGQTGTYLIVHSGSRRFGNDLHIHFCKKALEQNPYRTGELKQLSWLDEETSAQYRKCVVHATTYAELNQKLIIDTLCKEMKWDKQDSLFCIHNYIDRIYPNNQPQWDNNWQPSEYIDILHKGSISLKKDELGIIPINMAYGSFIVKGKGNNDWLNSAPHGAGRLLSRTQAKEMLTMNDYKADMKGVHSCCISTGTLDEAPMAYKSGDEIKELITPTADILDHLIPLYNYKS